MPKLKEKPRTITVQSVKHFYELEKAQNPKVEAIKNTKEFIYEFYKDESVEHLVSKYTHLYNLTTICRNARGEVYTPWSPIFPAGGFAVPVVLAIA
jgi:hypothetical protein